MKEKNTELDNEMLVEALFDKLPWLSEHYNVNNIGKVSFTDLNRKVWETRCKFSRGIKFHKPRLSNIITQISLYWGSFENHISFFSEDGHLLGRVGEKYVPRHQWSVFRFFDSSCDDKTSEKLVRFDEDIVSALKRINTETMARLQGLRPIEQAVRRSTPVFIVGVYSENKTRQMKITVINYDWKSKYDREIAEAKKFADTWAVQEIERAIGRGMPTS